MHERSLVRALLRQVEAIAAEHAPSRVVGIRVRIGEFSGVEAELVRSAYEELSAHTMVAPAELCVVKTPLEATCRQCGEAFRIAGFRFECASCGSNELTISGGEEMLLESVEMEVASHEQGIAC
jgi:hydrogenase nickel incorporation protein HypA/HybF